MFRLYSNVNKQITPKDNCSKCNKKLWIEQAEPLVWSCFYCGNLAYFTYGEMIQQIDIVRANDEICGS